MAIAFALTSFVSARANNLYRLWVLHSGDSSSSAGEYKENEQDLFLMNF